MKNSLFLAGHLLFTFGTFISNGSPSTPFDSSKINLQPVFVSASKWNENKNSTTKLITKIRQADVAIQNPQTAADLLAVSGEVFIQKSQLGGGSPMIRGFSTNRLLYSLDGIRLNNAIYRGGNIHNVIALDPFSMSNTEILFGPGSVTFGSDAIGAVMSFSSLRHNHSIQKKLLVKGKTNIRYSSANQEASYHYDILVAHKKWSYISSLSKVHYSDLKMGSKGPQDYWNKYLVAKVNDRDTILKNPDPNTQHPSGYDQYNLLQKIRYHITTHTHFNYDLHVSQSSEYGRYDKMSPMNAFSKYATWNYGPQSWIMNHLSLNHSKKRQLFDHFKLHFAHQFVKESRITRRLYDQNLKNQTENVNAYSFNIDFKKKWSKHVFYYGSEAVCNHVNSWGNTINISNQNTFSSAPRYPASNWNIFAIYGKYNLRLKHQSLLTAGLRANQYYLHSSFDNQNLFYELPFNSINLKNRSFNGNIGFSSFAKGWKLNTNLSTGFRSPNVDDIGKIFDFQEAQIIVPNKQLKSELAYTIDCSIAKSVKNYGRISMGTYFTFLDDAMVRKKIQVNGADSIFYEGILSEVYAIQNASYAYVYGLTVKLRLSIGKKLRLNSTLNYQKGKEVIDEQHFPVRHVAPMFTVTGLTFKVKDFSFLFQHQHNAQVKHEMLNPSEQAKKNNYLLEKNGLAYSPEWHVFHLKIICNLDDHLVFSGGIENLFGKKYRLYSSGISAPGRNFISSIKLLF